jgi:hypothetical protein
VLLRFQGASRATCVLDWLLGSLDFVLGCWASLFLG